MSPNQRRVLRRMLVVVSLVLNWSFTDWEFESYSASGLTSSIAILGLEGGPGIYALSAETRTRDVFLGLITPVILFSASRWFRSSTVISG